jgi:dolichol kinase
LSISAIFAVIIAVSEFISRRYGPSPEFTRKFVHINGGIACLFFPFFVKSQLTVLILAALFSTLFYAGSKMDFLKCLHGVERKTRGGEYYPFAIWALFLVSGDRLWLYVSSVLVLTAADACAALIGEKYGSMRYKAGDSFKSLEGSLFFWIIAFLAIHIPMLLLSDLPRETCILSALLVSFLVTCAEAVSVRGTDNIFVPVLTAYVLLKITQKPVPEIAFQCASLFAIFAVFGLIIWRSRLLDIGGGLIFLGTAYASWSLGSFQWALPAFAAFLLFTVVRHLLNRKKNQPVIRAKTLFAALVIPFAILVFANSLDAYREFFGLYLTAYVMIASFGVRITVLRAYVNEEPSRYVRVLVGVLTSIVSWLIICLPSWLVRDSIPLSAPICILGIAIFFAMLHESIVRKQDFGKEASWTGTRFVLTLMSIAVCWLLQQFHLAGLWKLS